MRYYNFGKNLKHGNLKESEGGPHGKQLVKLGNVNSRCENDKLKFSHRVR